MSVPTPSLVSACEQLKTRAIKLGVFLDEHQVETLSLFLTELYAYNEHTNLVADAHPAVVVQDHILDCLMLVPVMSKCLDVAFPERHGHNFAVVDVGSGAGFPGLILALTQSQIKMTLVDSVGK
ncbi:MAG: class I SAM-dependent methyltransferase [Candidatus Melainabacteria bacterium]|nr:class I SAM-dependent methyltransferase [Candidatus Melainabacteria bacterium]